VARSLQTTSQRPLAGCALNHHPLWLLHPIRESPQALVLPSKPLTLLSSLLLQAPDPANTPITQGHWFILAQLHLPITEIFFSLVPEKTPTHSTKHSHKDPSYRNSPLSIPARDPLFRYHPSQGTPGIPLLQHRKNDRSPVYNQAPSKSEFLKRSKDPLLEASAVSLVLSLCAASASPLSLPLSDTSPSRKK
jgi:hypothetical protein